MPGERQLVPLQQPDGQDDASHTQVLLKQRVPSPHAGPVPHRQEPVPQLFARVGSQLAHRAPFDPHAAAVGAVTQVPPAQQQLGHEVASHTHMLPEHLEPGAHAELVPQRQRPVSQLSALPAAHVAHVAPPLPQVVVDTAVMHALP